MTHKAGTRNGYEIWVAAKQPSKARRGGHTRSLQIRKDSRIVKQFRWDTLDPSGFAEAYDKCAAWIDQQTALNTQS